MPARASVNLSWSQFVDQEPYRASLAWNCLRTGVAMHRAFIQLGVRGVNEAYFKRIVSWAMCSDAEMIPADFISTVVKKGAFSPQDLERYLPVNRRHKNPTPFVGSSYFESSAAPDDLGGLTASDCWQAIQQFSIEEEDRACFAHIVMQIALVVRQMSEDFDGELCAAMGPAFKGKIDLLQLDDMPRFDRLILDALGVETSLRHMPNRPSRTHYLGDSTIPFYLGSYLLIDRWSISNLAEE